ncbi:MAG: Ig-like domain-containing protein, partial [Acidobacteriaceae bacterium]
TPLGSSTLSPNGSATLSTSFAIPASHLLSAAYSGDSNFGGATSDSLVENIVTPGYTVAANPSSLSIQRGQTGTVALTLTPVGNYVGTASFSCSGLPLFATCVFSPATVTLDGSDTVQSVTLKVYTLGTSSYAENSGLSGKSGAPMSAAFFWLPGGFLAGLIAFRRKQLGKRMTHLLLLFLLASGAMGLFGCGSGFPYTPLGTNTVTVTANATKVSGSSASQTATIHITITQ